MSTQTTNRIAELRRSKGLTQAQLAERLGVHWVTVSKLERGKMQLHTGWMDDIARALGVDTLDLLVKKTPLREVIVVGSISGAGAVDDFVGDGSSGREYEDSIPDRPVPDDIGSWFVIDGDGCRPYFHDGDKLFFVPVVEEQLDFYTGRFMMFWGKTGNPISGYLLSGSNKDRISVQSINGGILHIANVNTSYVLVDVRFAFLSPFPGLREFEPE